MSEFTQCDLIFVCRQTWNQLRRTDEPQVRYCDNCDKGVFSVRTRAQLELASSIGRCVALADDNDIVGWIGESDFDWMAEQSETVAVRPLHPLDEETACRLRMAFPRVFGAETRYHPPGIWIPIGTFSLRLADELEAEIRAQFPGMEIQQRPPRTTC